ncbi:hypothetical protein B5P46_09000 [Rhizobium leguminosarum]|uniref:Lipoprotein n=1 Tax=Rhizobium leguminosarum TaxID=384 RepID=A0A4Q1UAI5_RHILE|nr:hypothetical protein [Rhizobium leguminosarum]RXT28876.1 hypothetical protein B5P46_09000 [Rhizobium leguminosarum]
MKFRFLGAVALSFAVAGCTLLDPPTPYERNFRQGTKTCDFPITWKSARQVMNTLEIDSPASAQFWDAITEICNVVNAGNKSKAIEIRARDRHGVLHKIIVERD